MRYLQPALFLRLPNWMLIVLTATVLGFHPVVAEVIITEFVASNDHGLKDEDGASSDWIELQNQGPGPVNLAGWFLTDDAGALTKWRLPSTNLLVNDFLVVFASGKNRTAAGSPLHANFSLSAKGGYLALVKPGGVLKASEFNAYPPQVQDVSYGVRQSVERTVYVTDQAPLRYRVPSDGTLGDTWTSPAFDDSAWLIGTNGVGYQRLSSGFAVRWIKASLAVTNLNTAEAVLTNAALKVSQSAENRPTINYLGTGNSGRYRLDAPFPGSVATNVNVDDFVLEATGMLSIPSPGFWTFGVHSDAGFRLTVGNFTVSSNRTTASETLAAFNFGVAGDYPVRLMMYDRLGGSEVELYAAAGNRTAWSSNDFALVGDAGRGGLPVRSTVVVENQVIAYAPLIRTDLADSLAGQSTTVYLRIPFAATGEVGQHSGLALLARYDDGFVVSLNGTPTASRLAPLAPVWNSAASAARSPSLAVFPETINLTPHLGLLKPGANVLAIQGLVRSSTDAEQLWTGELVGYRYANSTNQYFAQASPGTFNEAPGYAFVSDTKFSHDRGFYETNFSLSITCETPGAVIRFTTNGSPPSLTNGFVYSSPIPIARTTTIRAAAFAPGFTPSAVDTHTYLFVEDVVQQSPNRQTPPGWPATWGANTVDYGMDPRIVNHPVYGQTIREDLKSLPSFSIVMRLDDLFNATRGIYANPSEDGAAWERAMSLELIYPDGRKGFQVNGGIRLRGGFSRSTDNPKHAFRFFFREEYGAAKLNFPVFGPDAAASFDKFDLRTFQNYSWAFQGDARGCFIRDVFSRDTQLALGQSSAHGDYYHLYINGVYWGLYNTEERPEASFGESYFGGKEENYDVVKVEAGPYTINATDGNMTAWTNLWKQAELGLATDAAYERIQGNNPDGTRNPDYPVLLDVGNLIDYMLVILFGGNLDAPISAFLGNNSPNNWYGMRDREGEGGFRFVVHDSEHTLLNLFEDRTGIHRQGTGYVIDFGAGASVDTSNPQRLWFKLHSNPEFRLKVADRLQKYCFNGGPLTAEAARVRFQRRMAEIERAVICESARWGDSKRPTAPFTQADWRAACETVLNDFLVNRTTVMMDQLIADGLYPDLAPPVFSQFGGLLPLGGLVSLSNPNGEGTIVYTLDGSDPRRRGGEIAASATPYSTPISLLGYTKIRARVKSGSNWSALVEPEFYADQDFSALRLTEVMYHPADLGDVSGDELEFIELKNVGLETLDLTGFFFGSGVTFEFAAGTAVSPGQFIVLGRNQALLESRYPGLKVTGAYVGRLDNAGEALTLSHPVAGAVWSFSYGDRAPWPVTPDGLGFSLVLKDPDARTGFNHPLAWRTSSLPGGSPGKDDPANTIPPIVINEILTAGLGNQTDQVELFNPTASSVSLAGWWLTDDPAVPRKFRFPAGASIAAGGFTVLSEAQFNPSPGSLTSFSFNSEGDSVYLFSGDASGELTGYSDGFGFGAAQKGVSFGRYLTSIPEVHYPAQVAHSFGAVNLGPQIGPIVISEVMYHPRPGQDEFVELGNISSQPVLLYDAAYPTNTWRLSGLGFSFPANVTLSPGETLLVVGIEPDLFRAKYRVPASVSVFGPWTGALQDDGERLELSMPGQPSTNGVPSITIDTLRYAPQVPWPAAANGQGPSLQRVRLDQYADDPANWFVSGMSPGRTNRVNQLPQVSLTSPAGGSIYTAPVDLTLTVLVGDSDGEPVLVEYFVDGQKIGETSTSPFDFRWMNVPTGSLTITARVTDDGFSSALSEPLQLRVNPAPPGNGIGLKAEYFTGTRPGSTRARLTRVDPVVDNHWGAGSPASGLPVDQFSIRWSGFVQAQYSGEHSFFTISDDGIRLWINNEPLVDNWTDHGDTENSGTISLIAGQRYELRLEYYENGGGATASLAWSAPNLPKQVIPTSQLYPIAGELESPLLLTPPQPLAVAVGASASFSVAAVGVGTLQYQWRFNGAPINGATSNVFTIASAQPTSEGNYDVVVRDDLRSETSPAVSLRTLTKPAVIQHPLSLTAVEGETVIFVVETTGGEPLTYRWRKGAAAVTNYLEFLSSAFYVITNVQSGHGGFYSVNVSNQVGVATSSSASLTILSDADGDHMADVWEVAHGLSTSTAADAALDPDNDGMSNLQEYLADTDPNDHESQLRLSAVADDAGRVILSFVARSNRTYTVQVSAQTAGSSWSNWVHLLPRSTNRTEVLADPASPDPVRIYRLITPWPVWR
ncbi:MAG: lamin tail domain-containing protein [Verrucomicrobiales bacterium]|nr:lamin tail domain-containing protein [Verrucomicrobiales bacterium]